MGGQVNTNTTHGSTNFDGSVLSIETTNTDAGFSIAEYIVSAGGKTYGHGLSQKAQVSIAKKTNGTSPWYSRFDVDGFTGYFLLDTTGHGVGTSSIFTDTTTGTAWQGGTETWITYNFHSVEGFSKIGSYIGNGKNIGNFIYTGFRPAFILVKSTTNGRNWRIYDNVRDSINPTGAVLAANETEVEFNSAVTYAPYDFVSNGFKLVRGATDLSGTVISDVNTSGQVYVYFAFASSEGSFKYANAR